MDITNCRDCDAPIFWVVTQKGKKVMMDADPSPDGVGYVIVETMAGQPVAVWHKWAGEYDAEGQDVHQFHIATCPDRHRKKEMRTAGHAFLVVIAVALYSASFFCLGMIVRGSVLNGTVAQIEREILEDVETAHEALLRCTIAAGRAQVAIDSVEAWVHRTGEYPQRLTWQALRSP